MKIMNVLIIFGFFVFFFSFFILPAYQTNAETTEPKSPGTNAEDSSVGTINWSHTDYDQVSDDRYVTSQGNMKDGDATVYLKVTNFGFSIPQGAPIKGISVSVERKAADENFFDNSVRLIRGGVIEETDKSSGNAWSTTDSTVTYGGTSDLWGKQWLYSDINDTNFGFAISVKKLEVRKTKNQTLTGLVFP